MRPPKSPLTRAMSVMQHAMSLEGDGRAVDDLERARGAGQRAERAACYQRSSAPSAAKPGPSAIMRPQSPGAGSRERSRSSSTKSTVAEDMLP